MSSWTAEKRVCRDCGQHYYSAGAHMERCTGPRRCRIPSCTNRAKPHGLCRAHYHEQRTETCECPAGWKHLPDCAEVTA